MFYNKGSFTTVPNLSMLSGKPPQLQVLFMWLCHHANQDGICFPSKTTLAKETGTSQMTVFRYIKELEIMGLVISSQRKKQGSKENETNVYKIQIGSITDIPPHITDVPPPISQWYDPHITVVRRTKTIELKPFELNKNKQKDSDFEDFWENYPKKVGKVFAKKSWDKLQPNKELQEKIKIAVEGQKKSPQWTKDKGQFIPHPATWLNQGRWDDQLPEEVKLKTEDFFY